MYPGKGVCRIEDIEVEEVVAFIMQEMKIEI